MKRYIQHEYLKISHFVTSLWEHPVHNHNHFEIIFVHGGKGIHCISGMKYPYAEKALFLLAPCDFHSFEIKEESKFTFIKFTNVYFSEVLHNSQNHLLNHHIDELMVQASKQELPVLQNAKETETLEQLLLLVVAEWSEKKDANSDLLYHLIQSILALIKRNVMFRPDTSGNKHSAKITSVLNFIHQNIYDPEKTRLENLAAEFGFSKHYFGIYFKDQVGMNLRDYVNQYKQNVIENRLKYSSKSIKEICDEFGFTDMSHFNKFFKTSSGITPSAFRLNLRKGENELR
jgi:YesN/AraC family two-component response regulator